ncbi:T9SS type B sorting domain-containing protein [Fibrella forsythiae]|uniref:Gliding motility-associated C-terminal domain-containing protein n=1 Tax=Fibrella forsythiae TaxID=2817061 RepID=A0ABS3JDQ6_9BACT|nr:gliding motility-associated C-terminal domain-containing protein [Fibrella forsythiae]MBO0948123.1 gliding motility-associated C-terminal domain-containing protein [Fibrella forsythiae]
MNKHLFVASILIGTLSGYFSKAQGPQNSNWYFGTNAGLSFSGGTIQAVTNGQLRSTEGCAARSDETGQLQFYTDGSTIWNRRHEAMPGATDLGGSGQSTQAALIVPHQASNAEFYVFSVAGNQQTGIQYARVNMTLNGGLGGLTTKNKQLAAQSTEKIATISHCNNLNHWVITHDAGTNAFRVNLLNDNGVIMPPTLYRVGSVHQQRKGYMKPSHNGRKLAVAVSDSAHGGFLEVFDFDTKTGAISNPMKWQSPETDGAYGLEFSPDNTLIYLTTLFGKTIYQLRATDLTVTARLSVQAQQTASPGIGALQLGPDARIYGTQPGETHLLAINQPNQPGPACNLVVQAVDLGGRRALAGLPPLIDTLPSLPPKLSISLEQLAGCNQFRLTSKVENLDSTYLIYAWYADGTAIDGANRPTVIPTKSGTYSLRLREIKCKDIQLQSNQVPVVLLEVNPTARAVADSCGRFLLQAHATGGTPQWTGAGIQPPRDRLDSLTVTALDGTQTYTVRVSSLTDGTCFSEKKVTVTFQQPAPYQLSQPTRSGCGDSLTVEAPPTRDWDHFQWTLPTGQTVTGGRLVARQSGQYAVKALSTSSGCSSDASLNVTLHPYPAVQLTSRLIDTCFRNIALGYLALDAGPLPNVTYRWLQAGRIVSSDPVVQAQSYGLYTLIARSSAGCETADSVRIVSSCPPTLPRAYVPDGFTPNQDGLNETLVIHSSGTERMTLTIYDRWGEVLYRSTDTPGNQAGWSTWDGTYRGQPVNNGLYLYRLEIKGTDHPDVFTRKGVIDVLR